MPNMEGMHILIVPAWWPSPEQPINGIFCEDYARAFAAAGAQVGVVFPDLVSPRYFGRGTNISVLPSLMPERLAEAPDVNVIRIRGLHTALGRPALQMRRFERWLSRGLDYYVAAHGEPDILHAMCAIPAGWACTRHAANANKRPVVITEHTGPFSLVLSPKKGERFVREALRDADAVIAVSDVLSRDMHAAGIEREIAVIHNPVGPSFVRESVMPPSKQTDANDKPIFHVVFVGRLTRLKGVLEIATAATRLAHDPRFTIHWHFVGDGELNGEIRTRFAVANIGDRLHMLGLCRKRMIANLVESSHVLLLPSHGENCPLAVCEALSLGRPVIGTRGTGCEALLGEGDGSLVEIGNASNLAERLADCLSHYGRWDHQAIGRRAAARFAPEAISSQYADLFRRLLSR